MLKIWLAKIKSSKDLEYVLIAAIILGLAFRLIYPFINNPLNHLETDPGRHFNNALHFNHELFSFLDPIGYQLWLALNFKIWGHDKNGIAIANGLLCVSTPCLWYLWLRKCLPSLKAALLGFLILTWLPSWLGIYAFFMVETLLLPLLGLCLWLSWRAYQSKTIGNILLAVFAWSCALDTKFSIVPQAIITLTWLFWSFFRSQKRSASIFVSLVSLVILGSAYLIPVWRTYEAIGTTWFLPPGGALAYVNQCYHLSAAKSWDLSLVSSRQMSRYIHCCGSPSTFLDYVPWLQNILVRTGNCYIIVSCDHPPTLFPPHPARVYPERWRLIVENGICFLFNPSWPDYYMTDLIQYCQFKLAWLWSVLLLLVLGLAVYKRRVTDILVILCCGTFLFVLGQEYCVMEGRYRKPWEGLVITASIYLLISNKHKSKNTSQINS